MDKVDLQKKNHQVQNEDEKSLTEMHEVAVGDKTAAATLYLDRSALLLSSPALMLPTFVSKFFSYGHFL